MSGPYTSAPSLTEDDWNRIEYWRAIVSGGPDCHVSIPAALLWRLIEVADRGSKRGAIRAKVLDWLAASSHGAAIASIRTAHIRHGGEGALYLVLKRAR